MDLNRLLSNYAISKTQLAIAISFLFVLKLETQLIPIWRVAIFKSDIGSRGSIFVQSAMVYHLMNIMDKICQFRYFSRHFGSWRQLVQVSMTSQCNPLLLKISAMLHFCIYHHCCASLGYIHASNRQAHEFNLFTVSNKYVLSINCYCQYSLTSCIDS